MVVIEYIQRRYVPLIQCDICGQIIADVCEGVAAQKVEMREGERIAVLHVHKGRCLQKAQARLSSGKCATLESQELSRHLHFLAHNMGMNRVDVVVNNIELDTTEGY